MCLTQLEVIRILVHYPHAHYKYDIFAGDAGSDGAKFQEDQEVDIHDQTTTFLALSIGDHLDCVAFLVQYDVSSLCLFVTVLMYQFLMCD